MTSSISLEIRKLVFERPSSKCEYCLFPQKVATHKHEPNHIIPIQHGGATEDQNLALACMRCNRYKGPNPGSFDPETGDLVQFLIQEPKFGRTIS